MEYNLPFVIKWALIVLAVYRLSFELGARQGPFNLFYKFRTWVTIKFGFDDWLEEFVTCPVCWSLLVAIPFTFLFGWHGLDSLVIWLSISGGAFVIHFTVLQKV